MLRMLESAQSEPSWICIPGVVLESRILNTAEGYLPTIRYEYNFEETGMKIVCSSLWSLHLARVVRRSV